MQLSTRNSAFKRRARLTRILRGVLLAILIPIYAQGLASDEQTHGDETYWSAAAWQATSLFFIERDFRAPFWTRGISVPILTRDKAREGAANRNPKLGMYLLGAPMLLTGVPRPQWTTFNFGQSSEWNRSQGRLPARSTLLAARLLVAGLGVAAGLWMFSLLCSLLHPVAAAAGALLVAVNPLVHLVCRRAMLDGPAYAFSIAAIFAKSGASTAALIAFITSWSLFAAHRIFIYEIPLLGPSFLRLRVVSVAALPIFAGLMALAWAGLAGGK